MLAPEIRVNCISPGGVFRNQPEVFVARYVERTPMRRMGREEDFKGAVAYLASDLSGLRYRAEPDRGRWLDGVVSFDRRVGNRRSSSRMKVLVTGADGFIGSHLTEALVEAGS